MGFDMMEWLIRMVRISMMLSSIVVSMVISCIEGSMMSISRGMEEVS
jgi:hypothetical protein